MTKANWKGIDKVLFVEGIKTEGDIGGGGGGMCVGGGGYVCGGGVRVGVRACACVCVCVYF